MVSFSGALTYIPTVLFWLVVLFLIISEAFGKFFPGIRPKYRLYAGLFLFSLVVWYSSEQSHNLPLTMPDFQPWSHFMSAPQPPAQ